MARHARSAVTNDSRYSQTMRAAETHMLEWAYNVTGGNLEYAADLLQISAGLMRRRMRILNVGPYRKRRSVSHAETPRQLPTSSTTACSSAPAVGHTAIPDPGPAPAPSADCGSGGSTSPDVAPRCDIRLVDDPAPTPAAAPASTTRAGGGNGNGTGRVAWKLDEDDDDGGADASPGNTSINGDDADDDGIGSEDEDEDDDDDIDDFDDDKGEDDSFDDEEDSDTKAVDDDTGATNR